MQLKSKFSKLHFFFFLQTYIEFFYLINKLLVPPESEDLSLAPFEGILSLLVGAVDVLEVIVGRLDPLVLEFVDGVNVQRNVILQTSGLGLAGQLSCGFGLKIDGRLKINSMTVL